MVEAVDLILHVVELLPKLLILTFKSFILSLQAVDFPLSIEFFGCVTLQLPLENIDLLGVLFNEFSKFE